MSVELLSRLQFAFTVMYHYLFAPTTIGISSLILIFQSMYLYSKNRAYKETSIFWTKIFGIFFIFGAATGIFLEFQFGTNWGTFSVFSNEVFASPLLAEGIFAFFLESIFLGILLYGAKIVSERIYFFSTIMVCLGAHLSAVWIIIANAWMQTPAGYTLVTEHNQTHAVITSYAALINNPSAFDMISHAILGAYLTGAFLALGMSAYFLLKGIHTQIAETTFKITVPFAVIALFLQLVSGDSSARCVCRVNPEKFASFEAIFTTQKDAPLSISGFVDNENESISYQVAIPKLLSFLAHRDIHAPVTGLENVPKEDRPNINLVFQSYHIMIAMWVLMVLCITLTIFFLKNRPRWLYYLLIISSLFPHIANQTGWMATELGRYPWIIYKVMRISDGVSHIITYGDVAFSLVLFCIAYLLLSLLFINLFKRAIRTGDSL